MKTVDIMEMLTNAIQDTIFEKWKHEGFICGFSSEHINFEIDNKEYVLNIKEVADGHHWSETKERILKIVRVKFGEKTDKTYDYEYIDDEPIHIGDTVIVEAKFQGKTEVKVVDIFCINESRAEYDYGTATKKR